MLAAIFSPAIRCEFRCSPVPGIGTQPAENARQFLQIRRRFSAVAGKFPGNSAIHVV
jgi:hypothetical protein